MARLKPQILEKLVKKTGLSKNTVRKNISLLKRNNPRCTLNAIAHIYATQHGFSVMQQLTKEDKETLPNISVQSSTIAVKKKKVNKKEKVNELIKYKTKDPFQKGHIDEVNRSYTYKCYTAAYIIARKVVENLILDILRKKFPPTSQENKELYYDITRRRYKDFEIILKNLYNKRHEYNINTVKPIERLYEKAKKFKTTANDVAHSWFYLISNKKEVDEMDIQTIINLIESINNEN